MPYCDVPPTEGGRTKNVREVGTKPIRIYYRTFGQGDCKIMMIMGVAATNLAWWPQIRPLTGTDIPNEPNDSEQDEEDAALRPAATSEDIESVRERAKHTQRVKSDLGHRLMMHGAQALADSKEPNDGSSAHIGLPTPLGIVEEQGTGQLADPDVSPISGGSGSSGLQQTNSESDSDPTTSLFERLDSEGSQRAMDGQHGHRGVNGYSTDREKLTGRVACVFDNRGVGRSSHPEDPKCYRTDIMAGDALAIADQLGWRKFHVIGHSMGGMIACKLAAMAPDRVTSLAVISASNGGFDCFPRLEVRPLKLITRMLSAKTPEQRAAVDLDTHFSENFLSEIVDGMPRRHHLHAEYVRTLTTKGAMQPKHATNGQLSACWNHGMTTEDIRSICQGDIPCSIIHGSEDVVAHVSLGKRIAKRLHPVARFVELFGGHMIVRERVEEVNGALIELLDAAHEGVRGESWADSDPDRAEADKKLLHCVSGSCGNCRKCVASEPLWGHVLDAS